YGLQLGGFAAGVSVNDAFEPSWTVLYGGETLNGGSYEVYTRGTDRGEVKATIAGAERVAASSYKSMQHGAKVKFNDFTVAGSFGTDKATDYAFLTSLGTVTTGQDNVERKYWNIGGRYDMGEISLSFDYDKGKINAPWSTAPNPAPAVAATPTVANIAANRGAAYSDANYDSWSVGAEYKIADGLVAGAGYKQFNKGLELFLDAGGFATGGFKMKDQSELRASLTLTF
ncbi:MAG: porin, partial [Alphaproteobacteria bacterium]